MNDSSLWHMLLKAAVGAILLGWPLIKIVRRTGRSGWWALLIFMPGINLIALWLFAFARWAGAR